MNSRTPLLSFLLACAAGVAAVQAPAPGDYRPEIGYIPMRDGVKLAYILYRPQPQGRFPVLLIYNVYWGGGQQVGPDERAYLANGYAVLSVSARGTGCSQGRFETLADEVQGDDGAAIVEWAGTQPWSDGNVGMYGNSYSGITQLMTGSRRPAHLKALAAGGTVSDSYSEVGYPGGIFNFAFMAQWTYGTQPGVSGTGVEYRRKLGDRECDAHRAGRPPNGTFAAMRAHPLRDSWWDHLHFGPMAERLRAPTLLIQGWQDQQTGSLGPLRLFQKLRAARKLMLTNGSHTVFHLEAMRALRVRWFDRWLKGKQNGIDKEPPVTIWFEADEKAGKPSWSWTFSNWPPPEARPLTLYMTEAGGLARRRPAREGSRTYVSPAGTEIPYTNETFRIPPYPLGTLAWRSEPLRNDLAVLGAPIATLHLSSDAPDTDLMVVLHDVAPDSKVLYVQRGLLRASHRATDPARSRPHDPFFPHDREEKLAPGQVYRIEVPLQPVGHVFRRGHRVEVAVMAPSSIPLPNWGFATKSDPAVNTVHCSAQRPSGILLPVLPGRTAGKPAPECGSLVLQPCRPSMPPLETQRQELDTVFRNLKRH